jgi:hypothetical protein
MESTWETRDLRVLDAVVRFVLVQLFGRLLVQANLLLPCLVTSNYREGEPIIVTACIARGHRGSIARGRALHA